MEDEQAGEETGNEWMEDEIKAAQEYTDADLNWWTDSALTTAA